MKNELFDLELIMHIPRDCAGLYKVVFKKWCNVGELVEVVRKFDRNVKVQGLGVLFKKTKEEVIELDREAKNKKILSAEVINDYWGSTYKIEVR